MMPPPRRDLIGFWDRALHVALTLGEAEQKFGARIYREGQRPEHLQPLFDSMTTAERTAAYGSPHQEDEWIKRGSWNRPPSPTSQAAKSGCAGWLNALRKTERWLATRTWGSKKAAPSS